MADKNRPLHILKYLWDHTDEEHPAIITDILAHLEGCGIHTNRKTVPSIKIGSRILVPRDKLKEWVENKMMQ